MKHKLICKDTSENEEKAFNPSTIFRIRLVGLIAARCLRLCCPFQIQVKGAIDHVKNQSFEDHPYEKPRPWIVIRYKENGLQWRTLWLLAVYPRNLQHRIILSDLLRDGPTSLPAMYQAFTLVHKAPLDPNLTIVLYTCQSLDSTLKIRRHRMPGTILDQPEYEGGYKFTRTLNPQIYAPEISGYQDFVKKLYIYTQQPGLKELEDMVVKEISQLIPCSTELAKKEMQLMSQKMALWWKVKRLCAKSEAVIDEKTFSEWIALGKKINPLKSSETIMNCLISMQRFSSIHFKKRAMDPINQDLAKTRILTLTAPKPLERALIFVLVVRTISKTKSIALDLTSGKSENDLADALAVWSGPLVDHLVVLTENDLYDMRLMEGAWYCLRSYPNKRLILVVPGESSLINSLCSEFNGMIRAGEFSFNELTAKSKTAILNKTIKVFGKEYPVKKFLPRKEFQVAWLDELLISNPIEITPQISNLKPYYKSKKLISDDDDEGDQIRVKIISGPMGCGKTTFLLATANQVTNEHKWNLISDLVQLETIISDGLNNLTARDMAKIIVNQHKDLTSSLARACFRQALISNKEFIWFIDGWDDLPNQRKARAMEILEKIVSPKFFASHCIYITCSNYSEANFLAPILNARIYELETFTEEDEVIMRQIMQSMKINKKALNIIRKHAKEDLSLKIWKSILGRPIRIAFEIEANILNKDPLDPLLILHRVIAQRLSSGTAINNYTSEIKVAMYYYSTAAALLVLPASEAPASCLHAVSRLRQAASCFKKASDPLISDWIGVRPRFRTRLLGHYFAAIWLAGSYHKVRSEVLRCIYEPGYEMIRSILDLILARQLPFHYAILSGYDQILPKEITLDHVNKSDLAQRTPLHLVSFSDQATLIAKRLIQISPNCLQMKCEIFEWTPIQYATVTQTWELVEMFLRVGGKIHDVEKVVSKKEALTIAEEATRLNYPNLLKCMIHKGVGSIDEIPALLSIAAQYGSVNCARLLIREGTNVHGNNFWKENGGSESLVRAISARSLSVARLLINAGADPRKPGMDGLTAICQAEGHRPSERLLQICK